MTGRYVHPGLQADLDSGCTTLCMLLKFVPVSGPAVGLCSTNIDVVYNDLLHTVTYVAHAGFDPSAVAFSAGTANDNSEADVLFSKVDSLVLGISEEMIDSGYMDEAGFILYLVNYENTAPGRHVEIESGKVGDIIKRKQSARIECLSRTKQLSQNVVCETGSITCRARFGDPSTGCGYNAEATWVAGTVTAVAEVDRQFTASALGQADGFFRPGLVEWLTGANAGRRYEVEQFATGGVVTLAHTTYYDIAPGDTFRLRKECPKTKAACIAFGQILNFRGEPDTPEGDSRTNQTPRLLGE